MTGPAIQAVEMNERSHILDAVRAVAILEVVGFHWFGSELGWRWSGFELGWTGVDLFFVLSGYLIGGILIDNRLSKDYFTTFYMRRIFRIVPLYLIFIETLIVAAGLGLPLWRYMTFTQNLAWAHGGLREAGFGGITWSLAVEEQFYLMLPIIVRLVSRRQLLRISMALIAAAPVCRWLLVASIGMNAPYVLLPGRMDTLFAGVLVALVVRNPEHREKVARMRWLLLLASAAAAAGIVLIGETGPAGFSPVSTMMYLVGYSLVAAFYASILLFITTSCRGRFQFAGSAVGIVCCAIGIAFSAIGKGAYSVYLFHQFVLASVIVALGTQSRTTQLLVAMAVTSVVGVASWYLVERPIIGFARMRWRYGGNTPLRAHASTQTAIPG